MKQEQLLEGPEETVDHRKPEITELIDEIQKLLDIPDFTDQPRWRRLHAWNCLQRYDKEITLKAVKYMKEKWESKPMKMNTIFRGIPEYLERTKEMASPITDKFGEVDEIYENADKREKELLAMSPEARAKNGPWTHFRLFYFTRRWKEADPAKWQSKVEIVATAFFKKNPNETQVRKRTWEALIEQVEKKHSETA